MERRGSGILDLAVELVVPLDGGRDTKQKGEDEAVVSADLQTNEHASERDGQPADLSFRLEVREKKKKKKKKERGKGGMRVSESE